MNITARIIATEDDIADLALRITDRLVLDGVVPDCTDTDDDAEFSAQDAVREEIARFLGVGE